MAGEPVYKDWKVPAYLNPDGTPASDRDLLGWLRESREQSISYLKGQRAWDDIDIALDALADDRDDPRRESLSNVKYNITKRCIREIVASMSNLRITPSYRTDNHNYDFQTELLNKRYMHWWHSTLADRGARKALQWASVAGCGYAYPILEREFITHGKSELKLKALGPRHVLPLQVGQDHDIQRAYAVTIKQEIPIFQAHAMFPTHADRLIPDRRADSYLKRGAKKIAKWLSPVLNAANQPNKEDESDAFPSIDLYWTYVLDLSINTSGQTIHMGDPGTRWEYDVPTLGSDIRTGIMNKATGSEMMRRAEPQDCLLFPLRRLIISSDDCLVKDGTSPWWHAQVPVIPFQMDDWPWEFIGFPMTHDTLPLQTSIQKGMRAIDDAQNVRLRPPFIYNNRLIPKTLMDKFDPRVPMQRYGVDASLDDLKNVIHFFADPRFYQVDAWMPDFLKTNEEKIKYLSGVADIAALAKARQLPGSDTMEKLMELMGPLVQDMSRNMDASICQLGDMMKCNFFEFDSYARRIQTLGPEAVTEEDFDYDPANLVPSHLPDETDQTGASRFTSIERAKWHCNNFAFRVTPGTLHQITSVTKKLMYLQLQKSGFPIDWWTMAEIMDVPNFSKPPEGANTVLERWIAQQRLTHELMQALGGPLAGQPGPRGGQKGTGGRSPSGHAPPQIKQRPNGASTVTESR